MSKVNLRNDIPLSEAFPDLNPLNLTKEQQIQLEKNICNYFNVPYNIENEQNKNTNKKSN